jgi:sigma-B regulation protein RsbU (phosphoserine phosphatase)
LTAGKSVIPSFPLKRFIRRQQSFIAIAVAIYAGLWAADRPAPLSNTLAYTLPLCNLIALVQDYLGFVYHRKRALHSWVIYVGLILTISVLGVAVVNLIEYPIQKYRGQTVWQFLKGGWKLPFMATMIVGVSTELYRRMRERLESRNRELQRKVELEEAEREQHGQELQRAREIQQSLLPKEIPQIAGFEIDGIWEPASVVGGDYFDVIRLSETKLAVCIADVVGKSVSAALLMANVQASVRAFATEVVSPATLCSRVNSVLCSNISSGKFVTLFYGVLDAERRTFCYSNAGHLLPILLRESGKVGQLKDGGAVLGVFPDWKYEESNLQLEPGDRLLLFTDGITEAELDGREEFGEQRLIESAQRHVDQSAAELKSHLLEDVKRFCKSQFRDDATLIVISTLSVHKQYKNEKSEPLDVVSSYES